MKIVNTASGKKEEFAPVTENKANIYVCGPTVYNYFHIGNARPFIIFDTLRRYLEFRGYDVTYVQNFTDVDDKMIREAAQEGITVQQLGERFIAEYFKDADALHIRKADAHPKATEHIDDIIALVQKLIAGGHAYEADGDVYFDVESYPGYGKLSGQDLSELEMGARVDVNDKKKNPMDFALWKAKKPGEIAWDSPWGEGRPGWHIECSAMSMKYLGDTVDIHGGGQDLKFPHHENEIAQSEAATGKPFVKYWMHNGYINIDNKKMSKSEGNFFTVRDILKDFDGTVIRLFMLDSHYASPINFSRDLLSQSEKAYERIKNARENLLYVAEHPKNQDIDISGAMHALDEGFNASMDDDLNTAGAIGVIFDYVKAVNTLFADGGPAPKAKAALTALDDRLDVLGLLPQGDDGGIPADVARLAAERDAARQNKDWAESDRLRDLIQGMGYEIKDTKDGAKISKL